MSPTIATGALVVDLPTTPSTVYHVGDVVTFHPTPGYTVTHRIAAIGPDGISTKGDANPSRDVGSIQPDLIVGRVAFSVPYGGYVAVFFQHPVGVAALLLLLLALMVVWQLTGSTPTVRPTEREHGRGRVVNTAACGRWVGVHSRRRLAMLQVAQAVRGTTAYFTDSQPGSITGSVATPVAHLQADVRDRAADHQPESEGRCHRVRRPPDRIRTPWRRSILSSVTAVLPGRVHRRVTDRRSSTTSSHVVAVVDPHRACSKLDREPTAATSSWSCRGRSSTAARSPGSTPTASPIRAPTPSGRSETQRRPTPHRRRPRPMRQRPTRRLPPIRQRPPTRRLPPIRRHLPRQPPRRPSRCLFRSTRRCRRRLRLPHRRRPRTRHPHPPTRQHRRPPTRQRPHHRRPRTRRQSPPIPQRQHRRRPTRPSRAGSDRHARPAGAVGPAADAEAGAPEILARPSVTRR